jgi:hypothetical protein
LAKKFYDSLKIGPNFFLQHFKNKVIFNFVKFMAPKTGMTTNFFHPSLLLLFFGPGSGMGKNQDHKHPESATLDSGSIICSICTVPVQPEY